MPGGRLRQYGRKWTDQQIIAESNKWIWDPPGSVIDEQPNYRLSHRPDGYRSSIVQWSWAESDEEAVDLIRHITDRAAAAGKQRLLWWLRPGDSPSRMHLVLGMHGFKQIEESSILAWELGTGKQFALPTAQLHSDVDIDVTRDKETLTTFYQIGSQVFGHPMTDENAIEQEASILHKRSKSSNFLARIDGQPAAVAGLTVNGRVGRLWGAGTVPEWRGRGAYKSLVLARLREAKRRGASLALTRARVGTSGPILRRLGFRQVGSDRCYALDLTPVSDTG